MPFETGDLVVIDESIRYDRRPKIGKIIGRSYDSTFEYDGLARYEVEFETGETAVIVESWLSPKPRPFEARKIDEKNWSDEQVTAFQDVFTAVNGSPYNGDGNASIIYAIKWLRDNPDTAKLLLED